MNRVNRFLDEWIDHIIAAMSGICFVASVICAIAGKWNPAFYLLVLTFLLQFILRVESK